MAAVENRLIELLPPNGRLNLIAMCTTVGLEQADVLYEAGALTRYVYFPIEGCVSLMAWVADHAGLEVGMVGREGMLGAHLALGVGTSTLRAVVQMPGAARRMSAVAFRRELIRQPALRREVNRLLYGLMG